MTVIPARPARRGRIAVGDPVPDFTLPDQDGNPVHVADLIAKGPVVIFFYPKDESMGCTAEVCSFRDQYDVFREAGATVVGISMDSAKSHRRFIEHHHLPFMLLSDAKGKVQKLFGVAKTFGLLPGRATYVIDQKGIVRYTFSSQFLPLQHVTEAVQVLQTLKNENS